MRSYVISLVLTLTSLGLGAQTQQPPTSAVPPVLTVSADRETFTVRYRVGAIFACTHYHPVGEFDQDRQPVVIHSCGFLDDGATSYQEGWAHIPPQQKDWDVWAEVGYPRPGRPADGEPETTTYVDYQTSNTVEVHR